jgi:two-component system, OmpR family, response regulator
LDAAPHVLESLLHTPHIVIAKRGYDWYIVIADDDDDWRTLMVSALQAAGFAVEEAADGLALMSLCGRLLAAADRPLLVVSDVEMPGMSGLEVLGRIRNTGSHVHALLVTGATSPSVLAEAAASGATRVLHKPVKLRELVGLVAGITQ